MEQAEPGQERHEQRQGIQGQEQEGRKRARHHPVDPGRERWVKCALSRVRS